ncbi:ABC transporter substrate-binding protein [Aquamicrobium sp. LC103]|uniref:ABC transporter substrate-binding protein n=1 Tax=Aquamicrobium sp. LC103 TaxID=1120658 RepID=UPI00063EBEE9|nr:ABC transporter substrate-binding protein [Aquamicrobium sp. LC103]TKT69503.1 ABC transporter substrate-binding protein [Aquamicrobium sp. LC103]
MSLHSAYDEVWYTRCQVPTASGIALDLGWFGERFARDGAQFGVLQDAPLEISLSHYDHSLRTLFREGGNVPAIVAYAEGAPTRLLGLTFIDEGQAIVAHPGRVPAAKDIAGARIAVPAFAIRKNASHARAMALGGLEAALGSLELDPTDVTIVETPPQRTVPPGRLRTELGIKDWPSLHQIADGQADAAYIKGAAAREAAFSLGLHVIVEIDTLPIEARVNNGTPRPITVHAELLEHRPEWVLDFLALTLKAADWAAANPRRTAEIVGQETGATAARIQALYGPQFHIGLAPTLDRQRMSLLQLQVDRLARHGFIDDGFDVTDWAEPKLLETAARLALTSRPTTPAF